MLEPPIFIATILKLIVMLILVTLNTLQLVSLPVNKQINYLILLVNQNRISI